MYFASLTEEDNKPTAQKSNVHATASQIPKYHWVYTYCAEIANQLLLSRRNDTNWSLVGEMRVGKMSLNSSRNPLYQCNTYLTYNAYFT